MTGSHGVAIAAACGTALLVLASGGAAQHQGQARAGVGRVDITPMPGFATAGHGTESELSRGYWGRLFATAFYFEDPAGEGAVLVSADLPLMAHALHRDVANHFRGGNSRNVSGVVLPSERVVVAATHTHHGPGHFFSSAVYNAHASPLFANGYSPPLRAWLSERIIHAVELAIADAAQPSTVDVVTGQLDASLLRNRSPEVFMLNPERAAMLASLGAGIDAGAVACADARRPYEPERYWKQDGCPRLRAVDRRVTMLRIVRGGRPHALAIFMAVHPTVLPAATSIYSADLFGVARAEIESGFGGAAPVVGFFNGSEGDVVARRTTRSARDLVELGRGLAAQLRAIHAREPAVDIALSAGITGRLHYARPGDREPAVGVARSWLTTRPLGGVAGLGGAEGDTTLFRDYLPSDTTRASSGEHGVKKPAFGRFHDRMFPPHEFPQAFPLGYVRLGDLHLATTPFEVSTAAAWRIRVAIGDRTPRVEVISLANDYASYMATAAEYDAQDYMGASTLWGPYQADFVADVLARLSRERSGLSGTVPPDLPGRKEFAPAPPAGRPQPVRAGYEHLLRDGLTDARLLPTFIWCGASDPPGIETQLVEVVGDDVPGRDADVVVTVRWAQPRGQVQWAAVWLTPLWAERQGRYRFRVVDGGREIRSAAFAVGNSPPAVCPG